MHSLDENYLTDTFVRLAKIDSASLSSSKTMPSTPGQKTMAKVLAHELSTIPGVVDIKINPHNFVVTATVQDNLGETPHKKPVIGLLAHMDTSSDAPTKNITPCVHKNYQGGNIFLPEGDTVIVEKQLDPYKSEDIITTSGSTLLGADDKAGIVEILETLRLISRHPWIKHPTIRIAFTPDEETGSFMKHFDIKGFGVDAAYTIDGGRFNLLETENFNGKNLTITINGRSAHPGTAKGHMINSMKIAKDFIGMLPDEQSPERTDKREGFYHINSIQGNVEKTELTLLLRDFNQTGLEDKYNTVVQWIQELENKYPGSKINIQATGAYENARRFIEKKPEMISLTHDGLKETLELIDSPLDIQESYARGRGDNAILSVNGLPSINLGAGGENFHSKNEFISVQEMGRCVLNIVNILSLWAKRNSGSS